MQKKSFYWKNHSELKLSEKLAHTLSKLGSFEWVRFSMFFDEDIYKVPPGFYFRFSKEYDLYIELGECIKQFNGSLDWIMYMSKDTKSRNFTIEPFEIYTAKSQDEFMEHYNVKEILKDRYVDLCDAAVKDIEPLCTHIEKWFDLTEAEPILPQQ